MPISNLDDLSAYLTKWYGVSDLGFGPEKLPPDTSVPETLLKTWLSIGSLSRGYAEWLRVGTPSPLACQDGFAAPGTLTKRDGYVQVVLENQGNWAIGYKDGDQASDPEVFSDFLEQEIGGTGFVPLGCRLSNLIITSALTETVIFGAIETNEARGIADKCDRIVWTGHYYNAFGYGADYETPSHQIRTNQDESVLALYWDDEFSGFLASSANGRKRLHRFLHGSE